jgi:uncharacterized protein DUF3485
MSRYLPILLGVLLIVGLTIPQIQMTDRLSGTNITAEEQQKLLERVPLNFGDWHGQDKTVDEKVKKTAGSIGNAVSREYRNSRTGERVDLWLIVGHARDISAHTPDICYPASGFEARAKESSLFPLVTPGLPETPFLTNTFYKEDQLSGRQLIRVFWTWFNPSKHPDSVVWEAPGNARWHFGNTRALYKMYFTSSMRDPMETAEQSAAVHFAKDFLPEVGKALGAMQGQPGAEAGGPAAETGATPPAETTEKAAATPAEGAPATDAPAASEAPAAEQPPADSTKTE